MKAACATMVLAVACSFQPGRVPVDGAAGSDDGSVVADSATDGDVDAPPPCTFGPWGTPQPIPELASDALDARPRVSPDERTIMFYSTRTGGEGERDIWTATRSSPSDPFGTPQNVSELNTSAIDRDAAPSADGLTVVFVSSRAGTYDVYISTRASTTSTWSTPEPVTAVNTNGTDYFTSLSPDGLTLYVSSQRSGGLGGFDIWYSTRATTADSFGAPQNFAVANSSGDDYSPLVSPDGRELYFSSNRNGSSMDIYVATRPDTASSFGTATRVDELSYPNDEEYVGSMSSDGRRMYFSGPGSQLLVATRTCQ